MKNKNNSHARCKSSFILRTITKAFILQGILRDGVDILQAGRVSLYYTNISYYG